MKKLFLFSISLFSVAIIESCGTTRVPAELGVTVMQKVIEVPNVTKDELFVRANAWAVKQFVSAEAVIEYSDKESGTIMGKYTVDYSRAQTSFRCRQTIAIEVRDGRIRITIDDPYEKHIGYGGELIYSKVYKPLKGGSALPVVNNLWKGTIASFEKAILETRENW